MMNTNELKAKWSKIFQPLIGRKIVDVRWMTDEEQKANDWRCAPVVIILDDGTGLWPSRDDEGNDAGALFLAVSEALKAKGVEEVAPVI